MRKLTAFSKLAGTLLLLLIYTELKSQPEINSSFSVRRNYVFGALERNRIPNGMLLEYAMEFTHLPRFDGTSLNDSNYVMVPELMQIYTTLYTSRIHQNGFTIRHPDVFDSTWNSARGSGKVVLAGIYYKYSQFKSNALSSNLIAVFSDRIYDKYNGGVWQNPYQTKSVFAISPSAEVYSGQSFQVVLPGDLWQTNSAGEISGITADFGDGLGFRAISYNSPLVLNYADTGVKEWKYKLALASGQILTAHSLVNVKKGIATSCIGCQFFGQYNYQQISFTAEDPYNGKKAKGKITIKFKDQDLGLRKPLIVIEGYDPGIGPENPNGRADINTFLQNVGASQSQLKNVLVDIPRYDIVYIDFDDGDDYIQRNGLLVKTIIKWINENKIANGGGVKEKNVVLGISMGGIIGRWVLRDMEQSSIDHQTSLFISMDASHRGANVPVAFQHMVRHSKDLYFSTNVDGVVDVISQLAKGIMLSDILNIANRPAPRQMLINWVNDNGDIDNSEHLLWENELKMKGMPLSTERNIAISNGSECAINQAFHPGDEMISLDGKLTLRAYLNLWMQLGGPFWAMPLNEPSLYMGVLPGFNEFRFQYTARAQPSLGVNMPIYSGKITYSKKLFYLIPIDLVITDRVKNSNPSLIPIDHSAGGTLGLNTIIVNSLVSFVTRYSGQFRNKTPFNFVPIPSALNIGNNFSPLTSADYYGVYSGGFHAQVPYNSPFLSFISAFNNSNPNEKHTTFSKRNGDWLAKELLLSPSVASDCRAFCANTEISGQSAFCSGNQVYTAPFATGTNYLWYLDMPSMGSIVSSGNTATFTPNPGVSGPVRLFCNISGDCGQLQLSKKISVGVPGQQVVISNLDGVAGTYCVSYLYSFQYEAPPTNDDYVTNYRWGIIDPFSNISYLNLQGETVSLSFSSPGQYALFVEPENNCGIGYRTFFYVNVGDFCNNFLSITASPNPVNSELYLDLSRLEPNRSMSSEFVVVKLYDLYGSSVKKIWKLQRTGTKVRLDMSDVKPGVYVIHVERGVQRRSIKVIVRR